jgi:hypothetical protein
MGRFTSPSDADQAAAILAEAWSIAVSTTKKAAE